MITLSYLSENKIENKEIIFSTESIKAIILLLNAKIKLLILYRLKILCCILIRQIRKITAREFPIEEVLPRSMGEM